MIVGSTFDGDNDQEIMMIQHQQYQLNVAKMVFDAKSFCKKNAELVQFNSDTLIDKSNFTSFDHRRFQLYHDIIAGYFRFKHIQSFDQTLFACNEKNLYRIKNEWQAFWESEIDSLTKNINWSKTVLPLAITTNQDLIDRTQKVLLGILKNRYTDFNMCLYFDSKDQ